MKERPQIVRELTPDLADKIINAFKVKQHNERVSKEAVLHHLKQIKAQMGKLKAKCIREKSATSNIDDCIEMIDKKIAKINK